MYRQIIVSALSLKPEPWDKAGNADRLEAAIRLAATDHPDLVVAPEGMLEGYVSATVQRDPARSHELLALAEPIDGPYLKRCQQLAAELRICVCFGFAERIGKDVYNSAVFIDDAGVVCGTYHKHEEPILRTGGGRPAWTTHRGRRQLRAIETPFGRCGMLICADRWYAWLARTLVLDGARFLLNPSYGTTGHAQRQAVLARARENGVPIAQANVGESLLISRGEVVANQRGLNRITRAAIDIPAPPSRQAARRYEQQYLARREEEQWQWLAAPSRSFPEVGQIIAPDEPASGARPRREF